MCTFRFSTSSAAHRCATDGPRTVDVPDVEGLPLTDAITPIRAAGLDVVGTGTPDRDPTGPTAIVRSQEPPAGTPVPEAAYVGFRTDT